MIFSSLTFVVFAALYFAVYVWLRSARSKRIAITLASYVFYGWWDARFLALIALSTAADFLLAQRIESAEDPRLKKHLLWASIGLNLGLLGVFKYFNFFAASATTLLNSLGFAADPITLEILLPVGISFYTFQTLGYSVDVYRGDARAERDPLTYAAYVAFFPQLVAGPIERATHLLPQLRELPGPTRKQLAEGLWLISWGYFLKVFVADNVARASDQLFQRGADPKIQGYFVFVGLLAFTLQIYGDFAGYSKIARGIARLHGVELMRNFNCPYFASSPADFWRRWHISLSTWLRDYLYIPLGGNRRGNLRTQANLMITMVLGGLWHGASVLFILWGAYQGIILVVHRWLSSLAFADHPLVKVLRYPVTFLAVMYGWLIFRCRSVEQLQYYSSALVPPWTIPKLALSAPEPFNRPAVELFWVAVCALLVLAVDAVQTRARDEFFVVHRGRAVLWLSSALLLCLSVAFSASTQDFIYFQF